MATLGQQLAWPLFPEGREPDQILGFSIFGKTALRASAIRIAGAFTLTLPLTPL